jgi:phosphoribosylanthranilate isomerase
MEIFLNKRAMRQVRLSVAEAIADGEIDALREDLVGVFSDDDIEEIERRIDSGDFYDFITEILEEWSGEDLDELMELLETQLADADVDLKYTAPENDDADEEETEEEETEEEETEEELIVDESDDDD